MPLLSEGLSTKDIAARLHISVKTIGTHREHIMFKLGMQSIAQWTRYAIGETLSPLDGGHAGARHAQTTQYMDRPATAVERCDAQSGGNR